MRSCREVGSPPRKRNRAKERQVAGGRAGHFLFFFTLVTGHKRSLSLKLSDTRVYAPQIRAGQEGFDRAVFQDLEGGSGVGGTHTLISKAHRWLFHSTLGSRVIQKKMKKKRDTPAGMGGWVWLRGGVTWVPRS